MLTLDLVTSTMVYVEGDATISTYLDAAGNTKHGLNIVQRTFFSRSIL